LRAGTLSYNAEQVDLINSGDPVRRAREVEALGVDIVCVHTAFDVQHVADPLETLRRVSGSEHRSVHFD
jgi:3-keto-L-gulonate-6-phosphate decarboxylase